MSILNLGVFAHVDAGKTSLTERLLYDAGVVETLGRVDAGTTRTDSLDLERQRGITIRSAVTAFEHDGVTVNVIDTPGHPDFVAEVERALSVLDAAVLVVSAVEGVQAQTVMIWRALARLRMPTILFVNKIDRVHADPDAVLAGIRERITASVLPLSAATAAGTAAAAVVEIGVCDPVNVETLADADESVLTAWADGRELGAEVLTEALRRSVRSAVVTPLLVGSAVTGAGTGRLADAIADLLPTASVEDAAEDGPATGRVFKIDRDGTSKRSYIRLRSGRLRVRDRLPANGPGRSERVTGLQVVTPDGWERTDEVGSGQVAAIAGWSTARIGAELVADGNGTGQDLGVALAPATLETVVEPIDPTRRGVVYEELARLADEDPMIALRSTVSDAADEITVTLYGEVHQQVVAAMLEERAGVAVRFRTSRVVCIERLVSGGGADRRIGAGGNPFLAAVGLRLEPAPVGSGVRFDPGLQPGRLPPAFIRATEEGVRATLGQGRYGWRIPDVSVRMTESGYWPRQSHAHQKFNKKFSSVGADFRGLAPVVVAAALRRARTGVFEPIEAAEIEIPADVEGELLARLGQLEGTVADSDRTGRFLRLIAHVPTRRIRELVSELPGLTRGEAVFSSRFDHHRAVHGRPPSRPRIGPDPFDEPAWYREVKR